MRSANCWEIGGVPIGSELVLDSAIRYLAVSGTSRMPSLEQAGNGKCIMTLQSACEEKGSRTILCHKHGTLEAGNAFGVEFLAYFALPVKHQSECPSQP